MLQEKGGRGFPHCVFMDSEGKVLKEVRPSDEASFTAGSKPIKLLTAARAAVAKKQSKKNQRNLLLIEAVFDPKEDEFEALIKQAKKSGVNKEIKALFVGMVETWPIRKAIEEVEDRMRDPAVQTELNKKLYGFYQKGLKVEDTSASMFDTFWLGVANHSIEAKDKKSGLAAIDVLEKKYEDNSRAMNYFRGLRDQLNAL